MLWKQSEWAIWERIWEGGLDYVVYLDAAVPPDYMEFAHNAFRFLKFRDAVKFILKKGETLDIYYNSLIFAEDVSAGKKIYKINQNDPVMNHVIHGEKNCEVRGKYIRTLRDCHKNELVIL